MSTAAFDREWPEREDVWQHQKLPHSSTAPY